MKNWEIKSHYHPIADTGDGTVSLELTNGDISLITNDEPGDDVLEGIASQLNNSGCKFWLDDSKWAHLPSENEWLKTQLEEKEKEVQELSNKVIDLSSKATGAEHLVEVRDKEIIELKTQILRHTGDHAREVQELRRQLEEKAESESILQDRIRSNTKILSEKCDKAQNFWQQLESQSKLTDELAAAIKRIKANVEIDGEVDAGSTGYIMAINALAAYHSHNSADPSLNGQDIEKKGGSQ